MNTSGTTKRPLIRLDGIGKTYPNGYQALSKVSLTIPAQPQFISLLGPSGCGKSTLLRIIAGLEKPSTGLIDWPTSDYDAIGNPMPTVGFVFQEPTLMPWAPAVDNVALPLATRPQVLLMDEPFAALDEITRHRLNDDLLTLWQSAQTTVIFVTHSVYESVYLSDRIVTMAARPGRITSDIAIDAPYPRGATFRDTPAYHAACRQVSRSLAETATPGDDQ